MAAPQTEAAYQLNPEVKKPTMALKTASEIGVLKNENPELKNVADKDAIVVMTFGTTFKDTRAKTIDATVDAIIQTQSIRQLPSLIFRIIEISTICHNNRAGRIVENVTILVGDIIIS